MAQIPVVAVVCWLALWMTIAVAIGAWHGHERHVVAGIPTTHPVQVRLALRTLTVLQCTVLFCLLGSVPLLYLMPPLHPLFHTGAIRFGFWLGVGMSQLLCISSACRIYARYRRALPAVPQGPRRRRPHSTRRVW